MLTILPINLNKKAFVCRNTKSCAVLFSPELKNDTISFSGRKSEPDLLSLPPKDIFKIIASTVKNKENKLGQGGEAAVYKIPDTPYCVRINLDYEDKLNDNFSLDVSKADKLNHVVANLGGNSSIMKYIAGYAIRPTGKLLPVGYPDTPKILENIPIRAIQNLLKQICEADKAGLEFDCCWPNVIINPKDNTLTAIDFFKLPEGEYVQQNPLSKIYSSLTPPTTSNEQRKKIAGKILLAAIEEFKIGKTPCYQLLNWDFSHFINKLDGLGIVKSDAYKKLLHNNFSKIIKLKEKELYENIVPQDLIGSLKVAESLVKQLFLN